ncbi:MAG: toxin [Candidatus Pacebacteria bacterium CG_4_10_14_0_8_um_filter_43_12]|nr:MAG: toxin [Candidatus Pacebacteria bacterium CG_4_10_14_0_8_um_filter_43_12]
MKYFDWNKEKNQKLKTERSISFQEVVIAVNEGKLIATIKHKDQKRHKHQKIYLVNISEYVCLVPFVEDSEKIFLKTIYPSRKDTKKYLKK